MSLIVLKVKFVFNSSDQANNGSLDAIRTHMAGLKKMIALRGGFSNAGFTPALQRLIGW
jgi:hypothetical protein